MSVLNTLNHQQLEAVSHQPGPILVVAGAGTGKTQVITHRVAYLIGELKVSPDQILALTFTEKAAKEMETRVSELLERFILDVKITTFNAFGSEVIKRFSYEMGINPNFNLLTEAQQILFLKNHLDELKLNYYSPVTTPEGLLAELAKYFSKLSNELITPSKYTKFAHKLLKQGNDKAEGIEASRHLELSRAYATYQRLKRQLNVIDFDDQVVLTVELLKNYANIRRKLQREIGYLLVDEFQDTNTAQSRLIDLLAGGNQNIMVVGDDDQSIYRFRGAAVANILHFLKSYPQAKQVTLTHNYRSSQEILEAAHRLIQHNNPDRLEARYQINKQLHGQFRSNTPRLKTFLTAEAEAGWIARDIKRRLKSGTAAGEIAVLFRKNEQAKQIERYLEAEAVDYLVAGQKENLYRQPVVKLLTNWLRAIVDPQDSESLYHLLVSEVYNLRPSWLRQAVASAKRQRQPLEKLLRGQPLEGADETIEKALAKIINQLDHWREFLPSLSVGQLCYQFLKESGYLKRLVSQARVDPTVDVKISHLNQFFSSLADFERIASEGGAVAYVQALPTLLGTGEQLTAEDLLEIYGRKVHLSTVHKAKGLEFKVVYLFDLTQGTFPARGLNTSLEVPVELLAKELVLSADPHLQEERRLMYVACTRAKEELILTYSADHGGRQARKPSIFIEEALGKQLALSNLKSSRIKTDQIELFRPSSPSRRLQPIDLPPHILKDEQLLLTVHQIEDYLRCPAEFYLKHVIAPPQPLTFALEYGNLIHNLIQFYNRRRLDRHPPKLSDLFQYLEANWPTEAIVSSGHHRRGLKQAKQTLRNFFSRETKAVSYPRYIEHAFEVALSEVNVKVRGRFDAVYDDPEVEIRDYKTGSAGVTSQAKADARAKQSLQLGLYALAWEKSRGELPQVLALDFVDSGLIGKTTKSSRQLQTLEEKIKRVAEGIRSGDFRPAGSHLFCTHSDYGF